MRDTPVSRWYPDDLACAPSDSAFAALKLKTNEIEQSVQDANRYHQRILQQRQSKYAMQIYKTAFHLIFHLHPPVGGDHVLLPVLVVGLVGVATTESVPE